VFGRPLFQLEGGKGGGDKDSLSSSDRLFQVLLTGSAAFNAPPDFHIPLNNNANITITGNNSSRVVHLPLAFDVTGPGDFAAQLMLMGPDDYRVYNLSAHVAAVQFSGIHLQAAHGGNAVRTLKLHNPTGASWQLQAVLSAAALSSAANTTGDETAEPNICYSYYTVSTSGSSGDSAKAVASPFSCVPSIRIVPGATVDFALVFAPGFPGVYRARLLLQNMTTGDSHTYDLEGVGLPPPPMETVLLLGGVGETVSHHITLRSRESRRFAVFCDLPGFVGAETVDVEAGGEVRFAFSLTPESVGMSRGLLSFISRSPIDLQTVDISLLASVPSEHTLRRVSGPQSAGLTLPVSNPFRWPLSMALHAVGPLAPLVDIPSMIDLSAEGLLTPVAVCLRAAASPASADDLLKDMWARLVLRAAGAVGEWPLALLRLVADDGNSIGALAAESEQAGPGKSAVHVSGDVIADLAAALLEADLDAADFSLDGTIGRKQGKLYDATIKCPLGQVGIFCFDLVWFCFFISSFFGVLVFFDRLRSMSLCCTIRGHRLVLLCVHFWFRARPLGFRWPWALRAACIFRCTAAQPFLFCFRRRTWACSRAKLLSSLITMCCRRSGECHFFLSGFFASILMLRFFL
jgi:hypothetical protein